IFRTPFYFLFLLTVPCPSSFSTLSLHDALPIFASDDLGVKVERDDPSGKERGGWRDRLVAPPSQPPGYRRHIRRTHEQIDVAQRSEEHTSELQSRGHLVCRLLLEKKKQQRTKRE